MRKIFLFCLPLPLIFNCYFCNAQLIINEVSQGPGGNKEYVEFVVTSNQFPYCDSIPCVDFRGWYIDDNNGYFNSGSGTGIAKGCIRFANDNFWSCVKPGTIILIYNSNDKHPAIPTDDPYDSNNDCILVIPISSTLFETNLDYPNSSSSAYPTTGFISGGDWNTISMSNSNDSYQTLDPTDLTKPYHSVSYNNNSNNTNIYFPYEAGGTVFYFDNAINDDPFFQSNWQLDSTLVGETPGVANNTQNASWITSLNNNCSPVTGMSYSYNSSDASCNAADGFASLSVSGGLAPYTYLWSDGQSSQNAINLANGNYTFTITDANGCTVTDSLLINSSGVFSTSIISSDASCNLGNGKATVSVSNPNSTYTYLWNDGQTTQTATNLYSGTYYVTVVDSLGCTAYDTIIINTINAPEVVLATQDATCNEGNGYATASVSGGSLPYTYLWSNGATDSIVKNLSAGTYTIQVMDDYCTLYDTLTIQDVPSLVLSSFTITGDSSEELMFNYSFYNLSISDSMVSWNFGDGNISSETNPSHKYSEPGNYLISLIVMDGNGCTDTSFFTISIEGFTSLFVPNAFTPNFDNLNNVFEVKGLGIEKYKLVIFNRWGQFIFESNKIEDSWDGKYNNRLVSQGTYIYRIIYTDILGKEYFKVGHVSVVY